MKTIASVIAKSYKSFIYISILLLVFVIIFSLLGMSLFGGKFNYSDGLPRGNYDSIGIACITVFQLLTMENWISVFFDSIRSDINKYLISIYYVIWIFIGNFILLNLFLAILLDSFLEEDEEDADFSPEVVNKKTKERVDARRKRRERSKVIMYMPRKRSALLQLIDGKE